jgi:hypothetical protein
MSGKNLHFLSGSVVITELEGEGNGSNTMEPKPQAVILILASFPTLKIRT